ncbi:MAG: hypothetical protein WCR46_21295 [Deltaproteobacteria bacterium]|jgi:hypothetical protein
MKSSTQQSQKMAAAISAVFGYIRSQEDAAALAMSMDEPAAVPVVEPSRPTSPVKLWGVSGRQEMMSMRNLMQLRTFQGSKLR